MLKLLKYIAKQKVSHSKYEKCTFNDLKWVLNVRLSVTWDLN